MTPNDFTFSAMNRRNMLRVSATVIVAGIALPVLAACSAEPTSTPAKTDTEDLLAAAKKEGKVSLYSSASTDPSNAIAEGFKAKYGIPVEVYRAGSSDIATRVQSEEQARRTLADVLIIEEPALSLLIPYLAKYDSPARKDIDDQYKGDEYTLIRMYNSQIGWNSDLVKDDKQPKGWEDLLDPQWSGRLGSLDPHVTATTLAWQVLMVKEYGEDFLKKFGENKPKLYASTNAMSQAIISGEIDLGVTNSFGVVQMAQTGAPMVGIVPDKTVLYGGNVSVFSKAPNPNAARLFVDYACSAEGQTLINVTGATIPTHPDATSDPKVGTLADLSKRTSFSQPDYKKIIAETETLLAEWDKYIK